MKARRDCSLQRFTSRDSCKGMKSAVALEAYPGLLVRKQLGLRASYKSDTRAEHTPERKAVRRQVLDALMSGQPLGIKLKTAMGNPCSRMEAATSSMPRSARCRRRGREAAGLRHSGARARGRRLDHRLLASRRYPFERMQ
jgi:hypothetical protein